MYVFACSLGASASRTFSHRFFVAGPLIHVVPQVTVARFRKVLPHFQHGFQGRWDYLLKTAVTATNIYWTAL